MSEDEVENELMGDAFSLRMTHDGLCMVEIAPNTHVNGATASMIKSGIARLAGDRNCSLILDLGAVTGVTRAARNLTAELITASWLRSLAILGDSQAAVDASEVLMRAKPVVPFRRFDDVDGAERWGRAVEKDTPREDSGESTGHGRSDPRRAGQRRF